MYHGEFPVAQLHGDWEIWSQDSPLAVSIAKAEHKSLVDLWILGDRLYYTVLQDWIVETIKSIIYNTGAWFRWWYSSTLKSESSMFTTARLKIARYENSI